MPFRGRIKLGDLNKTFEEIDRVVISKVYPNLIWIPYSGGRQIYILPNYLKMPSHQGPTKEKNPRKFFALECLDNGLSYAETELWLDTCFDKFIVKHTDGVTREITAHNERIFRLDRRKPIYYFDNVPKSGLGIYIR